MGPFRADILCKEVGSSRWVLIENQLEKTDHVHLGQLMTYAAGLDAVTIVWVSPRFTEEHRACLDWLNRITTEGVDFFAVELEVWQIGESALAPKFNLVSKPNAWVKSVAATAQSVEHSDRRSLQVAYWTAFHDKLKARNGPVKPTKAHPESWMGTSPFNRGGFGLNVTIDVSKRRLAVDLYLRGKTAASYYQSLLAHRLAIDAALGELTWHDQAAQDRRVIKYFLDIDPSNEDDWDRQQEWFCDTLEQFYKVFAPIVSLLQPAPSNDQNVRQ